MSPNIKSGQYDVYLHAMEETINRCPESEKRRELVALKTEWVNQKNKPWDSKHDDIKDRFGEAVRNVIFRIDRPGNVYNFDEINIHEVYMKCVVEGANALARPITQFKQVIDEHRAGGASSSDSDSDSEDDKHFGTQ